MLLETGLVFLLKALDETKQLEMYIYIQNKA